MVREYVRSRKTLVRPGERRPSRIVSHMAEASSNVLEDGLLGRRGWALIGAPKRRLEDDRNLIAKKGDSYLVREAAEGLT